MNSNLAPKQICIPRSPNPPSIFHVPSCADAGVLNLNDDECLTANSHQIHREFSSIVPSSHRRNVNLMTKTTHILAFTINPTHLCTLPEHLSSVYFEIPIVKTRELHYCISSTVIFGINTGSHPDLGLKYIKK